MRFHLGCVGVLVNPRKPSGTFYLDGVQNIGCDNAHGILNHPDTGRIQPFDVQSTDLFHTVTMSRILASYTDENTRCPGPFLHHIFTHGSYPEFNIDTGPSNYRTSFLPKNIGMSYTESSITPSSDYNIKDYDISIIYNIDDASSIQSSKELSAYRYNKCVMTSYSISAEVGGVLSEDMSFESKTFVKEISGHDKTVFSLRTPTLGKTFTPIMAKDFNKTYSVLPSELGLLINSGLYRDSQEIYGIQSIESSVSINYYRVFDEGKKLGVSGSDNNMWLSMAVPLEVETKINVIAHHGWNSSEFVKAYRTPQQLRLVFNALKYDGSPTYFVINLGKKNYLANVSFSHSVGDNASVYNLTYRNANSDFVTYFTNLNNFSSIEQTTERY